MPKFDRKAASDYALAYALYYNPGWYEFTSNSGGGGDCSNFISQALLFGGWPMVRKGDGLFGSAWYAKPRPTTRQTIEQANESCSPTWRGAEKLYSFFVVSGRTEKCDRGDLEVGDVVSLSVGFFDSFVHHMMVTKIEGRRDAGQVFLSYHSSNNRNKPLGVVLEQVGEGRTYDNVWYTKIREHIRF